MMESFNLQIQNLAVDRRLEAVLLMLTKKSPVLSFPPFPHPDVALIRRGKKQTHFI